MYLGGDKTSFFLGVDGKVDDLLGVELRGKIGLEVVFGELIVRKGV
jgi:hypothetical protein